MTLRLLHLSWTDEWTAHDPWGRVKPTDVPLRGPFDKSPVLTVPRGGYGSIRLLVRGRGAWRVSWTFEGGVEADLYRAWYHCMSPRGTGAKEGKESEVWYPDALIPQPLGSEVRIPDPDNRVPGQQLQEFWLDVFAPSDAQPGRHAARLVFRSGREMREWPMTVDVSAVILPEEPFFVLDNNSYGGRWLLEYYPAHLRNRWRSVIELLHHYYRLAHEHRMTFHNLGYGHSGEFDPIYGPRVEGVGHRLRLVDWELFDALHGPLLDGSAFHKPAPGMPRPRRPATPVWGIYTPFNPQWPSSVVKWGLPGYEVEFRRGVEQFDAHLRERGWTGTRIELFFNHKKRYRWFDWDGDECKFAKDDAQHHYLLNLWQAAIDGSPVPWVYRVDASWRMKDQFRTVYCGRNFWVIGGFCAWYRREVDEVLARGDLAWGYGGYADLASATADSIRDPFAYWARGLTGYCEWLAPRPGRDPWFNCDGAPHGVFYPGERFGIAGPLPSIRLKVLRNALQDMDLARVLLDDAQRQALARRTASWLGIRLWETPPPAARRLPPEDWDYRNLAEGMAQPLPRRLPTAEAWRRFRRHTWRTGTP